MLIKVLLFELRYRLNRPATYIYFGLLFFIAFLFIATDVVSIGGGQGNVTINSPYTINQAIVILNLFAAMICSAIMGVPVYRDFDNRFHEILFTSPLTKNAYLIGRFLGSLIITLLVMSAMPLGIMIGSLMPWIDPEQLSPFNLSAYTQPFLTIVLPNTFFMGAIFFMVGSLTRNIFAIYVQGVMFLILYLISNTLTGNLDDKLLAALLDPMGINASSEITKFWTPAQRNQFIIPLQGALLYNRLLWIAIGSIIYWAGYKFFKFNTLPLFSSKKKPQVVAEEPLHKLNLPPVQKRFDTNSALKQFWKIFIFEAKMMYRTPIFMVLVSLGIINAVANIALDTEMYDISTFPVTGKIIQYATDSFQLFFIIIITFYTAELVWRERSNKINQIADSLPVSNQTLLWAKLFGMIGLLAGINLMIIIVCALIQFFSGYSIYEFSVSFKYIYLYILPTQIFMVMFAFFVHALINNKFFGHAVVILTYIINIALESNGFENNLYRLGSSPYLTLSDLNGFGHFLAAAQWFNLYWLLIGLLLIVFTGLFWMRGTDTSLAIRLKLCAQRFNKSTAAVVTLLVICAITCGAYTYHQIAHKNLFLQKNESRQFSARMERQFKKYEKLLQPRVVSINNEVDIFPHERGVAMKGQWWLKNIHQKHIDTVVLNLNESFYIKDKKVDLGIPAQLVLGNDSAGVYLYKLQKPLLPGDSMLMNFSYSIYYPALSNSFDNTSIVDNGTFLNNSIFPIIGYNADLEISSNEDRKKEKLPKRKLSYAITDSSKYNNNYISNDADWIRFETTVSTVEDQIAIAPGYLQKEWKKDGRRYFHYKMDAPILNFYSYLSATYEVKRDRWNDVNIEIYYHKGHEYNIDRMTNSIKESLAYFSSNFSPYQHKQARIIEFPGYSTFAQSFPNTIPYSERIGFILDITDPKTIDASYYVTAHEIAHQWWAHQVVGCPVDGMTVFSESMAEYSAMMVMKKRYGRAQMKKFLSYALDNYLGRRGAEREKEQPLLFNQNQSYIHYSKGCMVMYALQEYIGEEKVNRAAANFIKKYQFKGAPYPNALDFYSCVKAETPDSLHTMLDDLFKRITVYNNTCKSAKYVTTADKKYLVNLELDLNKYYADSLGNEKSVPLNDWIDVGAVDENDSLLFSKRIKVTKNKLNYQFVMNTMPYKVGIDPLNQLIDKDGNDNLVKPQ